MNLVWLYCMWLCEWLGTKERGQKVACSWFWLDTTATPKCLPAFMSARYPHTNSISPLFVASKCWILKFSCFLFKDHKYCFNNHLFHRKPRKWAVFQISLFWTPLSFYLKKLLKFETWNKVPPKSAEVSLSEL